MTANTTTQKATAKKQKAPIRGRKPLTEMQKVIREYISAEREMEEVAPEFEAFINGDNDLMKIAEKRIALLRIIDEKSKEAFAPSRMKRKSAEVKELVRRSRDERAALYAELNQLPPLGVHQSDWDAMSDEEKAMDRGRPQLPLETRYYRANDRFEAAKSALEKQAELQGMSDEDIEAAKEAEVERTMAAGRPNGGLITQYEKVIRRHEREIEKIDSGEHAKKVKAKMAKRAFSEKGMLLGKKFETSEEKRAKLVAIIEDLKQSVVNAEAELDNLLFAQRKTLLLRKEIKAQNELLDSMNIDIESESKHPEVVKLLKLEAEYIKWMKARNLMETGQMKVTNNRGDLSEIVGGVTRTAIKKMAAKVQKTKMQDKSDKIDGIGKDGSVSKEKSNLLDILSKGKKTA